MSKKIKILVIRFSSIGDIVLTTPIVRCIKLQLGAEIDYLTNSSYESLINKNKYLNKVHIYNDNFKSTLKNLKEQKYDYIIDLQNNFRSILFCLFLSAKVFRFKKNTLKRLWLIYTGNNRLNNHIVDRYFTAVLPLNVIKDKKKLDFICIDQKITGFDVSSNYISWCIGGSYEGKKLSPLQISNTINEIKKPVVLIGGDGDQEISSQVLRLCNYKEVFDFCGKTNLMQSALLIKNSQLLLTNDTGMMHIAASFSMPIISFWGCTKPSLGFSPYMSSSKSVKIITPTTFRPCSKHGKTCRVKQEGCIKNISSKKIIEEVNKLIK